MIAHGIQFRECLIPDTQTKMLALCLSDDENGIFMPTTQRKSRSLEFRADYALKEIISQRIKNNSKILPLALRKRQIYENALKEAQKKEEEKKIIKQLENFVCVPLLLRKHLIHKESRAG